MPMGLAIGAGVGLLKNEFIDKPQAATHNKLQAEIARYSPWTHMQAGDIKTPNPFDAALQFGSTGAMISSGIKNDMAKRDYLAAQSNLANTNAGSIKDLPQLERPNLIKTDKPTATDTLDSLDEPSLGDSALKESTFTGGLMGDGHPKNPGTWGAMGFKPKGANWDDPVPANGWLPMQDNGVTFNWKNKG